MQNLLVNIIDKKIYITLNRPSVRNALNQALILELTALLEQVEIDDNIRLVCLKGSNQFFCAGADLKEMKASIRITKKENIQQANVLSILLDKLYRCTKPTVAVVEGGAYGGGLGLIACCDIVLSTEKALFCFSEAKLGLIPALVSPYIIKAIGQRNAKRYFLTAEVFHAEQAKEMGLIHEVTKNNTLEEATECLLNGLSKNGSNAMAQIKKLFPIVKRKKQDKLIALLADIRTTEEAQKRLSDFLQGKGDKA